MSNPIGPVTHSAAIISDQGPLGALKYHSSLAAIWTNSLAKTVSMYLRFVYAKSVEGMSSREGFFQAAGEVANNPLSDALAIERIDVLRKWFSNNLKRPVRFSRSRSKGYYRKETKGLSWFKPCATEHISKAFELKSILDDCGYAIEVLKEGRIGYVVYEDEHQVVAEPFAETAT